MRQPIYLDCHSTTPVDPAVLQLMLPWFSEHFGNAGSRSHRWGEVAEQAVEESRQTFAACIGCQPQEIVFTSGATESNNLAILGVAEKVRRRKNRCITLATEHPSVLDPLRRLANDNWEVVEARVADNASSQTGRIDFDSLQEHLTHQTAMVSIAAANNEIGTLQQVEEIAELAHRYGALLHVDASQAVGWMDIDVGRWKADLISFSAHKFYGPKGVGALYVRSQNTYDSARPVRMLARTWGGGQEGGRRSGTLNTPGIVGIAAAMRQATDGREDFVLRTSQLRNKFWQTLSQLCPEVHLNGPELADELRSPNNLNFRVEGIEGQTIMARVPEIGMSSGSACSSVLQGGSSVLKAVGLSEDQARCSLRLGFGRQMQWETLEPAVLWLAEAIKSPV